MERIGDQSGTLRAQRWVLVVGMVVSAVLGIVASRSYLTWHNTLANNGNWVSTKTTLERGLLGAYSFINGRQTLAGGVLHLDAWHGHNEVTFARPLAEPTRIEFDTRLGKQAYLVAFFNRVDGEDYDGVRLSARGRRTSGPIGVSSEGRFVRFDAMQRRPLEADRWYQVRIDLTPDYQEISIDGEVRARLGFEPRPLQRIGFRSGFRSVEIDNVVVTQADGSRVTESFDRPSGAGWITAGVVALLLLANVGLLLLLRKTTGSEGMELGFYFLMVNVTLLVIGALVFLLVLMRADRYLFSDDRLAQEQAYFQKGAADKVVQEARERYSMVADEGVFRILFLGGSQTWGAGALYDEDVFVPRLEALLNEVAPEGVRYECINAGISASKVRNQHRGFLRDWSEMQPDMVVLNVSSNDKATARFTSELIPLVEAALAGGAEVVLIKEANSLEKVVPGLIARHAEMEAVASELDLPIIDMHTHLESRWGAGFLWWDFVHLTSYGQRLMAEKLFEELQVLLGEPGVVQPLDDPTER